MTRTYIALPFLLACLLLAGCATPQLYRTAFTPACEAAKGELEVTCAASTLQREIPQGEGDATYWLSFIEFDDQGQLFDRAQMHAVTDELNQLAGRDDLLMVVFVHGWKHSAAPGDGNIRTFRETLRRLSLLEANLARIESRKPRQVAGIYLAWRGASLTLPWIENLSFWERKNTAHKVGHGGMTEVLNRLEQTRNTRNQMAAGEASRAETRLVVVGHSFGGAAVFSSLSQILMNRFVDTEGPVGVDSDVTGFGDLVVLINPAFEAARFTPLSDMANERASYFASQLPVLAILTSEADWATRYAFPVGRTFSSLFEYTHDTERTNPVTREAVHIDQSKANTLAIGHYSPYRTHRLSAKSDPRATLTEPSVSNALRQFRIVSEGWDNDHPGSRIDFDSTELKRSADSVGKNPYLVIQVDEDLIRDHNDIDDPRIMAFVRQLILLSSQHANPAERRHLRGLLPAE